MYLIGDIGGTKTVLAIFSAEAGPHKPLFEKTYPSARYTCLEDIVREFLSDLNISVDGACFGVAGPVVAGAANITNLSWIIDENRLKSTFGWSSVKLLNDLEAVAYAVPILEPGDIHTLSAGRPVPYGNIAVLAPGTGLGEAFMTFGNGQYKAHASEGSHAAFGPADKLQDGLLRYMRENKGFEHVSYERVCSGGLGIPNLYAYLKDTGYAPEPAWLAEKLAGCDDITPVIIQSGQDKDKACALCAATLGLFVAILGAEAGNLALKVLSTGGIYIGGGIPPRILSELQHPAFLEAIRSKGRFREILTNMPVHIILNARAGLLGAAAFGLASAIPEIA